MGGGGMNGVHDDNTIQGFSYSAYGTSFGPGPRGMDYYAELGMMGGGGRGMGGGGERGTRIWWVRWGDGYGAGTLGTLRLLAVNIPRGLIGHQAPPDLKGLHRDFVFTPSE